MSIKYQAKSLYKTKLAGSSHLIIISDNNHINQFFIINMIIK